MIDFKLVPDVGEPWETKATSRDIVQWEKTNRGKTFKSLMDNMSMADLTELAWRASVRTKMFAGTLKEFELGVDLEFDIGEEPDPTPPGQSPVS